MVAGLFSLINARHSTVFLQGKNSKILLSLHRCMKSQLFIMCDVKFLVRLQRKCEIEFNEH